MGRKITIVGGGVAGLTLGILLRRREAEVEVEVIEAGRYPRHRVCGEFVSGRGGALLKELGLAGLRWAETRTTRFFVEGRASRVMTLPEPGLAMSRYDLDAALAREFARLGGVLSTGRRWTGTFRGAGVVRATGRRLLPGGAGFVGLKLHARGVGLEAGMELHFGRAGYAGICALPNGSANICGLFRRGEFEADRDEPKRAFAPILGDRLKLAVAEQDSFCTVAGVTTGTPDWGDGSELSLGDSIAVIPPLTGNGMSLAMESSYLAAARLEEYCAGTEGWHETAARFSQECKRKFGRRLRVSAVLQKAALHPKSAGIFLSCLRTMPGLMPLLFRATR